MQSISYKLIKASANCYNYVLHTIQNIDKSDLLTKIIKISVLPVIFSSLLAVINNTTPGSSDIFIVGAYYLGTQFNSISIDNIILAHLFSFKNNELLCRLHVP